MGANFEKGAESWVVTTLCLTPISRLQHTSTLAWGIPNKASLIQFLTKDLDLTWFLGIPDSQLVQGYPYTAIPC